MEEYEIHGVRVSVVPDVSGGGGEQYESTIVLVGEGQTVPCDLRHDVTRALAFDRGLERAAGAARGGRAAGGRLVLAPLGPLSPYDDVRAVRDAAAAGVARAADVGGGGGAVLALAPHERWPRARLVALLAALEALYVPLQIRESFPALYPPRLRALGVYCQGEGEEAQGEARELLREAVALERARALCRDIGGADPERMAPLATARYLQEAFSGAAGDAGGAAGGDAGGRTRVSVRVLSDLEEIKREYPLLAAVSRAADTVPRHAGCVIFLEYEPKQYEETVMLVGKGVTYDTGGCDIKAGGVMAGMSRDKCGAAAVAGFLKACEELQPALKVVAALGMVRNSVGEAAYVADELLRSRRGDSVRIGNTDAEGRLVMADLLAHMHERAGAERRPHLYTVATLTGHAHRAYGPGYTAALDSHAAAEHAERLRRAGHALGDMLEVSRLRREDLAAHRGRAPGERLHQADSKPSVATPRGHQAPAAFLLLAAGLDAPDAPRYTHLDVAASAGDLPLPPTAAPLLALAAHYGLLRSH